MVLPPLWSYHFYKYGFWIRLGTYGKGISAKWDAYQSFSERNGYRKTFRVGKFMIERLDKKEPTL